MSISPMHHGQVFSRSMGVSNQALAIIGPAPIEDHGFVLQAIVEAVKAFPPGLNLDDLSMPKQSSALSTSSRWGTGRWNTAATFRFPSKNVDVKLVARDNNKWHVVFSEPGV
ncbi:hypothetical protein VM1G_11437 [Cytospora mali]|uniref:Uncharacterized protein n=1 Tax=Cytospora mali TaxID=578113 RepID=A0A194VQ66_CYTMA|nr:hypothetical protein VM1G_11437 [Valsa mali]